MGKICACAREAKTVSVVVREPVGDHSRLNGSGGCLLAQYKQKLEKGDDIILRFLFLFSHRVFSETCFCTATFYIISCDYFHLMFPVIVSVDMKCAYVT
jgi:hypothetical protein